MPKGIANKNPLVRMRKVDLTERLELNLDSLQRPNT
jgi:hypothetical protein